MIGAHEEAWTAAPRHEQIPRHRGQLLDSEATQPGIQNLLLDLVDRCTARDSVTLDQQR
jgi:hypothetical protein